MFKTTPIALMKTTKLVLPAEMNGSGSPVGGIEPLTTAMFRIVWILIIAAIPKHKNAVYLLLDLTPIMKILIIRVTYTTISSKHPINPVSSAMIENIKSDSLNGKNNCACLELNNPTPHTPPLPIAYSDWIN